MQHPVVHVVYRYAAAVGDKPRPDYFSKKLALHSFLVALEEVRDEVAVTFLVDGDVEADVEAMMRGAGALHRGRWGSNRASYAEQLRVAAGVRAELVWFAEDDYLYAADALHALVAAVQDLPGVSWFALSGPTPLDRLELRRAQSAVPLPRSRHWAFAAPRRDHERRRWQRIDSTTSTFGGRPEAIRRATWLLRLCPWTGAAWDRTTCLALQGATPYPWAHLLSDLAPPSMPARGRALRVAYKVLARLGVNLAALTQRRHEAVMVAPVAHLVGHMDLPYEQDRERWDALAGELLAGGAGEDATAYDGRAVGY